MNDQVAPDQPSVPVPSTSKAPASIFAAVKDYPTIRDGSLVIVYLVSGTFEAASKTYPAQVNSLACSLEILYFPSPSRPVRQHILAMALTVTQA